MSIRKKRKGIEVTLEGGSILSLDMETAATANLKSGQSLSREQRAELSAESGYKTCYDAALHFLSFRQRSEKELKSHLIFKRGFKEEEVQHVVDKLRKLKLLDDEAFAEQWKNDRVRFKPKSRIMIQRELIQKGVNAHTIQYVTQTIDDEANAYNAGLKKAGQLRSQGYKEFYRKMSGYLGRRGYSSDVVYAVVARLWKSLNKK